MKNAPPKKVSRMTRYIFAFAAITCMPVLSNAQNLLVNLNNGATETYPVSEIQSIKFDPNTLILNLNNGSILSYAVNFIDNYSFSNVSSIDRLEHSSSALEVFPNPAKEWVNIHFKSEANMHIAVDIIDTSGKLVEQLFSGQHSSESRFVWQPDQNMTGAFICRIQSDNKVITKKIIVR